MIYKGTHSGWYAVSDEAFYPDGQVTDYKDAKTGETYKAAIETGQRVEWAEENNYKFKLSEMQGQLLAWLSQSRPPVQPAKYHAQIVAEVEMGLTDLSISRPASRLHWGIPVPSDPSQSIYVWVDALTNYLTVTGYPWPAEEAELRSHAWPADVHVVGKDILRFHAIYWPALLLAADVEPPHTILSHGHWTKDKSKMSKSRGNVVDPFRALKEVGCDTLRFFLMRVGGNFAEDADYSDKTLKEFHRKLLQGQLGNLASRVNAPKILKRLLSPPWDDGSEEVTVTIAAPPTARVTQALEASLASLPATFDAHMGKYEFSRALEAVFDVLALANEAISQIAPWAKETPVEQVQRAVFFTRETLRIAGLLMRPVMPEKMEELLNTLRDGDPAEVVEGEEWETAMRVRAKVVVRVSKYKVQPLFPKLELGDETV